MLGRNKNMSCGDFLEISPDDVLEVSVKLKDGREVALPDPPSKRSILNCLKTDLYWLLTGR